LNCFLNNNLHPFIELKVDSLFDDIPNPTYPNCINYNSTKVDDFITNILNDVQQAATEDQSIVSRITFIAFYNSMLSTIIKKLKDDIAATPENQS
jgi:hypothetical protein